MKTIAILLACVAVASAFSINPGQNAGSPAGASVGAAANTGAAAGGAAAGGAANPGYIDYGPKVYGIGAKNPFAMPPNPFQIQRAIQIANQFPNVLVRLDMDGDVELTNHYGQEVNPKVDLGYGVLHELEF